MTIVGIRLGSSKLSLNMSNIEQAEGTFLLIMMVPSPAGAPNYSSKMEGQLTACGSLAIRERSTHETRNDRVAGLVGAFSPGPYRQQCQPHGDEPVSPAVTRPNRSSTQTYFTVAGAP